MASVRVSCSSEPSPSLISGRRRKIGRLAGSSTASSTWKSHASSRRCFGISWPLTRKSVTSQSSSWCRARHHDEDWLVTLFLVNGQEIPKQRRDEAWLFQVELAVEDPASRPIFRRRPEIKLGLGSDEQETRTLAMLYRD